MKFFCSLEWEQPLLEIQKRFNRLRLSSDDSYNDFSTFCGKDRERSSIVPWITAYKLEGNRHHFKRIFKVAGNAFGVCWNFLI